jgi:hypothetical protein
MLGGIMALSPGSDMLGHGSRSTAVVLATASLLRRAGKLGHAGTAPC